MPEQSPAIEQILKRAIRFEQEAYDFYASAIELVKHPHIQETLKDLADEEVKHKEKLQSLLEGNVEALVVAQKRDQIQDLELAEYLVVQPLGENATFQQVLVVAMQREKSAHDFYSTMAGVSAQESVKNIFEFLAREELGHKNKVETLYDEVVYQEF